MERDITNRSKEHKNTTTRDKILIRAFCGTQEREWCYFSLIDIGQLNRIDLIAILHAWYKERDDTLCSSELFFLSEMTHFAPQSYWFLSSTIRYRGFILHSRSEGVVTAPSVSTLPVDRINVGLICISQCQDIHDIAGQIKISSQSPHLHQRH